MNAASLEKANKAYWAKQRHEILLKSDELAGQILDAGGLKAAPEWMVVEFAALGRRLEVVTDALLNDNPNGLLG